MNYEDNKFASLSLIFGVVGILTITSVLLPLVLGGLAVIFAVLSKGNEFDMDKKAKAGFYTGLIALILTVCLTAGTAYLVMTNDDVKSDFNEMYKDAYGISFDEYMNSLGVSE